MKDTRLTLLALLASAVMVIVTLVRGAHGTSADATELVSEPKVVAAQPAPVLQRGGDFARSGPGTGPSEPS